MKKLTIEYGNMEHKQRFSDWILTNNHQWIVVNKPNGLPVQNDLSQDISLHHLAEKYCKKKLFVSHRIDRPVSGVVLLAKKKEQIAAINQQFADRTIKKVYFAITQKKDIPQQATLNHYLVTNAKLNKSFCSEKAQPSAKEAVLEYEVISEIDHYWLLKIIPPYWSPSSNQGPTSSHRLPNKR